jgi:hypothetical protein
MMQRGKGQQAYSKKQKPFLALSRIAIATSEHRLDPTTLRRAIFLRVKISERSLLYENAVRDFTEEIT